MKTTATRRLLRSILWRGQRMVNWFRNKLIYARDARALNQALFADIAQFSEQEVNTTIAKIHEFCTKRGYDKDTLVAWNGHVYRVMLSEKWIAEVLDPISGDIRALDLGEESVTTDYWKYRFPKAQWENTDYDLRYAWKASASYADLIVCTELVEHLSDQPNVIFNEGFYKLGFVALLRESFRVLKPGGILFITTPNAASILHIKATLQGDPPWFFIKHVREYTLPEVVELLTQAGFEIMRKRDVHCMSAMAYSDYSPIFQLLLENGFHTDGRGDDLFVLARKPEL